MYCSLFRFRMFLYMSIVLFSLFTSTVCVAQPDGVGSKTYGLVIGDDDRKEVTELWLNEHPKYRGLFDAIGMLCLNGNNPNGSCRAGGGQCTATHVGSGLVITAGHCFSNSSAYEQSNLPCSPATIQWGYRKDRPSYLTSRCTRVRALKHIRPYDYAILEVDPIPPVYVRAIPNAGSSSGVSSPGTMFGHPYGRALTWSGTCYMPPFASAVAHTCDSEKGTSGALIIEDNHLVAVGIHYGDTGTLNAGVYLSHTPYGNIINDHFRPRGRIIGIGGKCLDVAGGNSADRTPIQLWDCNDTSAQEWSRTPFDMIIGLADKCLDTPSSENLTRTWLFGCHGESNQNWSFQDSEIRGLDNKCLDAPIEDPSSLTRTQLWECNGGDGQKWTLTKNHEIKNQQGKCLDSVGSGTENGNPVALYDCHGGANQMWDIFPGGSIRGIGGRCLDVSDGNSSNGTPLQLWDCNGTGAQRWYLRGAIRGLDGKCLDALGSNTSKGTPVIVHDCHFAPNQLWSYFP